MNCQVSERKRSAVAFSMKKRLSNLKSVMIPFDVVTANEIAHVTQYMEAGDPGALWILRSAGTAREPTVIVSRKE